MISGALSPYEGALREQGRLSLVAADGTEVVLAIQRYLADADPADATVLARCVPPVLDVGCGPGRIVHALASSGQVALGVDIAEAAVSLTQQRGAPALSRDVFDRVPGEGRWPTVLLLDGNVGIGGDVAGLLRRAADLMAPGGAILAEASAPEPACDQVLQVRFSGGGRPDGPQFPWSVVGRESLARHAGAVGLIPTDHWSAGGRDFLRLARPTSSA